jgi:hypothetical protein
MVLSNKKFALYWKFCKLTDWKTDGEVDEEFVVFGAM